MSTKRKTPSRESCVQSQRHTKEYMKHYTYIGMTENPLKQDTTSTILVLRSRIKGQQPPSVNTCGHSRTPV